MDFNDVMVAFNAILRSFNMEMDMWHAQQNQHVLAFQNGHSQRLSRDQLEFLKSLCSRYMPSQIIRECPPPPQCKGVTLMASCVQSCILHAHFINCSFSKSTKMAPFFLIGFSPNIYFPSQSKECQIFQRMSQFLYLTFASRA